MLCFLEGQRHQQLRSLARNNINAALRTHHHNAGDAGHAAQGTQDDAAPRSPMHVLYVLHSHTYNSIKNIQDRYYILHLSTLLTSSHYDSLIVAV